MQNFMSIEEFLALPEERQVAPETVNRLSFETLSNLENEDRLSPKVKGYVASELYHRSTDQSSQYQPAYYRDPYPTADNNQQKTDLPKYPLLKTISKIMKILGWILLGVGALVFLIALIKLISDDYYYKSVIFLRIYIALGIAILGLFSMIGSEIITVFTDISLNIAAILKRLEK